MTQSGFTLRISTIATFAVLLVLFLATSRDGTSQTSADGSIYGHVSDSSGAALIGVQITAHSPAVGGTFKAITDSTGDYRLKELPPDDNYTLEVEQPGFEKVVRPGLDSERMLARFDQERASTVRESIPRLISLSATCRRAGRSCSAKKTVPMPPWPISSSNL